MDNMIEMWDAPVSQTQIDIGSGLASGVEGALHRRDVGSAVRGSRRSAVAASPSPVTMPAVQAKPPHVLELAMHAFGDLMTAEAWLNEPHARLGGTPMQQCQLPAGQERVLQLLCAISSGTEP